MGMGGGGSLAEGTWLVSRGGPRNGLSTENIDLIEVVQ